MTTPRRQLGFDADFWRRAEAAVIATQRPKYGAVPFDELSPALQRTYKRDAHKLVLAVVKELPDDVQESVTSDLTPFV